LHVQEDDVILAKVNENPDNPNGFKGKKEHKIMTSKSNTFSILFVAQKGKLKANGKAPIFASITVNGEMVHLLTYLGVEPNRWLSKEGRTVEW
jgi:hypothetical protein